MESRGMRGALDLKTTVCAAKNQAFTIGPLQCKKNLWCNFEKCSDFSRENLLKHPQFGPKFRIFTNFWPLQCTISLVDRYSYSTLLEACKHTLKGCRYVTYLESSPGQNWPKSISTISVAWFIDLKLFVRGWTKAYHHHTFGIQTFAIFANFGLFAKLKAFENS